MASDLGKSLQDRLYGSARQPTLDGGKSKPRSSAVLAPKPAKSLQRRAGKSVGGKKGKALPQPVGFKSTAKLPSAARP